MNSSLYSELSWLPQAPQDFTGQCRLLAQADGPLGTRLQRLANHALTGNQLSRLAKALAEARRSGKPLAPLTPFRLGVVSNSTLDLIVPALEASALRHGIALECIKADYGQVIQEALSSESTVNRARPDAVLLNIDLRYLPIRPSPGDRAAAEVTVASCLNHLQSLRQGHRENGGAISIVQTLAPFPESLFGSLDRALPGAPALLD